MSRGIYALLIAACILGSAFANLAQLGYLGQLATFRGSEWLMDDPHKADRMPVWSQLLSNQGTMTRSRGRTGSPQGSIPGGAGWRGLGENMNLMRFLMNFDY